MQYVLAETNNNSCGNSNRKRAVYPNAENPYSLNTFCACTVFCSTVSAERDHLFLCKYWLSYLFSRNGHKNPSRKCPLLFIKFAPISAWIVILLFQIQQLKTQLSPLIQIWETHHNNTITNAALFYLHHIVHVGPFLESDAEILMNAIMSSRLDYCNMLFSACLFCTCKI